jgi:glycerol-3-phosphate dehydrogenase (NAD(P)+)
MKVTIIGAGAMGSALTIPLSERNEVNLWGTEYDVEILEVVKGGKEHPRIMARIPEKVKIFFPENLEESLKDAELVVLGVSTAGVKPIVERVKPYLKGNEILVTVTKGLIEEESEVYSVLHYMEKELKNPIVAISGPSIAKEVANKNFTKVVFSSKDINIAKKAKEAFETEYYRVETSDDVIGCELASAFKNVYSIALAWPIGLEKKRKIIMNNLRGILITKALEEISLIVEKMGGKKETVYGLAGIGDMVATAGGGRNGMLGELLGEGKSVEEALEILREKGVGVIEGYENIGKARKLVKDFENEIPLFRNIYEVLFADKKVEDAIREVFC